MSIVKSKHASNYTVLPNEIFNSGLSIEAIGLLSYFLSLPHDWVIYKTQLHNQLNMGREKVDRIFKELQTKGYLLSVKQIDDKGKFTYNHIIYDKSYNGEPTTELPPTDKPHTEKPLTDNIQLLSTNIQSTKLQSKEELKKDKEQMFEEFWNMYEKKVERKSCMNKFLKLNLETIEKILLVLPEYIKSTPEVKFRKNPETWLNGECWNDEIIIENKKINNNNIKPTYGTW